MNVVINHIDERLIHSRILLSWAEHYSIEKILVIDDWLPNQLFEKSIMMFGAPSHIDVKFLTVAEGMNYFIAHIDETQNALVLFKSPQSAHCLHQLGYCMNELNVGCMMARVGRHKLAKDVYISKDEIEVFRKLMAAGIRVTIQAVPAEPQVEMADLIG